MIVVPVKEFRRTDVEIIWEAGKIQTPLGRDQIPGENTSFAYTALSPNLWQPCEYLARWLEPLLVLGMWNPV